MRRFQFLSLRRLAVVLLCCAAPWSAAQVALRAELAKPLQAAQEALKASQPAEALRLVDEARAVPKLSAGERVLIERLAAAAALTAQQYALAIPALEFLVQSAEVPAADKLPLLESLVQASQRSKDYPRLVAAARQYLQAGGTKPAIRLVMVQALQVQGQHAAVVNEVGGRLRSDGAAVSEDELRLLGASQLQLKDQAGYYATLKLLVARHPTKDYWVDLISRLQRQPGFNNRLELDVYRLLDAVGGLDEADDLSYMASLALKAGLPAEASRILEQGYAAKRLGSGPDAGNHDKLRQQAAQRTVEDDKALPTLEKSAVDGNALAQLGDVLASKGLWERANAAYASALAKGGLRREAEVRLHHGVGLLQARQTDAARGMLASVRDEPTALELASLWALLLK